MKWRFVTLLLIFLSGFIAVALRLGYWQIVKADELTLLGEAQYKKIEKTLPRRGDIRTSDNFPLVTNKLSYLVVANPKVIPDADTVASRLAPILTIGEATISAMLQKNLFWIGLQHIDAEKKYKIEKLNIDGISFEEEQVRFYPESSMAAHLIGFVGKDAEGNNKGYFGLEGFYERQLRGRSGKTIQIQDAYGRPVIAKTGNDSGQKNGRTLRLHIDRAIQYFAESQLQKGVEQYEAESGMVIVMDPKTGGVLAMAALPDFDPQQYGYFPQESYKNPVITDLYEPGSTFKPLIMAKAMDKGLIKPDTICTVCNKPVEMGGFTIRTWNNKYYENISMIDVIRHSDNTGMVFIAQKLGLDGMLDTLGAYRIGDSTGIDLEGEVEQGLKPRESWYPIDVATASFGQGISMTPMQLIDAFASIANGGVQMEPHVVDKILTDDGENFVIKPKILNKPISASTARIMTEILVNAVNNGEAKWAKLKGYRIAGKTGTASIPVNGKYDSEQTIASFIGFAPADDPRFVMLVVLRKPQKSIYGAETAAPIFFSIAKNILTYYGIAPTEEE